MAVAGLSREKIVGSVIKVLVEDELSYLKRFQEERSYYERRVSMASEAVGEYTSPETARMYIDFQRHLKIFDATPFARRRWFQIAGLRIPLLESNTHR
jgi:hypothetical protein